MNTIISLDDISKSYREVDLFAGLDWHIEQGRTYGLVGANGTGKSVLLKIICGFVKPDRGSVFVDPRFLDGRRVFPDRFGVTIDGPAFQSGLSARANLMELLKIRGHYGADHARSILELVGLDPKSRKPARTFSLGMKQKLSLAQAFMEEPDVLLLDEPFNALDTGSVDTVKQHLRDLRAGGKTIIFTSHVRSDIDDLCDSVSTITNRTLVTEMRN